MISMDLYAFNDFKMSFGFFSGFSSLYGKALKFRVWTAEFKAVITLVDESPIVIDWLERRTWRDQDRKLYLKQKRIWPLSETPD